MISIRAVRWFRRVVTALTFTCACAVVANEQGSKMDESTLTTFLERERVTMKMPGLRAAVRYPDGVLVAAATGLADVENDIVLDNDVGMPGGSTGKTFVAALTMLLVEDGVLGLDDPAARWLAGRDWFDRLPYAGDIRIRHLLSHSAGVGDYPGKFGYNMKMVWRVIRQGSARFEPEELIGFAGRKRLYAPGEGFRYSDVGYLVLGRVIEAATGRTYYDLLAERILTPMELKGARPQDRLVIPNITPGYTYGQRNIRDDGTTKMDPSSEWTGGGLVLTPTALVRFHGALASGEIVSDDSYKRMVNGGWRNPKTPGEHYGFGLFVHRDGTWVSHGGLWMGYRTHVLHDVEGGMTVAVQTNRDGGIDMAGLAVRLVQQAKSGG